MPPLWVTLCDSINATSGDHNITIQRFYYNLSFKWPPAATHFFNVTQWTNYGKFGFLNIKKGTSMDGCIEGDIYKWNISDWNMRGQNSDLINASKVRTEDICGETSIILLNIPFDKNTNFLQIMEEGSILQIDSLDQFQGHLDDNIASYWIPYQDINGSYTDISSGEIFNGEKWCNGQPNNIDHRCISCEHCCYDVSCSDNGEISYSLIQYNYNKVFTLRLNLK